MKGRPKQTDAVVMPIECLVVEGGQKRKIQLGGRQQAKMINLMSEAPQKRMDTTNQMMKDSGVAESELVRDMFKLQISPEMISQPCRILQEPKLEMG